MQRSIGALGLFILATACSDAGPTAPVAVFAPLESEGFYFLPPLNELPSTTGVFNPLLSPRIEICGLDLTTRDADLSLARCLDPDPMIFLPEEVVVVGEAYELSWDTSMLTADRNYRVHVFVGGILLGYHDVRPVAGDAQGPRAQHPGLFVFRRGERVQLAFGIDERALCDYDGVVVIDCDEQSVELDEGGTVATENGGVTIRPESYTTPGGATPEVVHIIVEELARDVPCLTDDIDGLDLPRFGPCFRIRSEPVIEFLPGLEAVVSVCVDLESGLDLGPDFLDLTEAQRELVQIHKYDETTGQILALPNVQSTVCGLSQGEGAPPLPSNPLLQLAVRGARALKGLVGPRRLVAADLGLGGLIRSFSRFQWALPVAIQALEGDGQLAPAGSGVPVPPAVRLVDQSGNPVRGARVRFRTPDGGSVTPADPMVVESGADGIARVESWILGQEPGVYVLEATGLGLRDAEEPYDHHVETEVLEGRHAFSAIATGSPTAVTAVSGATRFGTAGTPLLEPLVVVVRDASGNPLRNVEVLWTVSGGGGDGRVSEGTGTTDDRGRAEVAWTLGSEAGANRAVAAVETEAGTTTVEFRATAGGGAAARVSVHAGDGQVGTVGAALSEPLAVRVSDALGNALAGVTVLWSHREALAGEFTAVTTSTGGDGVAEVGWTLGRRAGDHVAMATVLTPSGAVVTDFEARARPGPAASIAPWAGNLQVGTVARALPQPLVVSVSDAFGNSVPGASVDWSVTAGGGSIPVRASSSNASGLASAVWTIGPVVGEHRISAFLSSGATVTFRAEGAPGVVTDLVVVSGDGQAGGTGRALPEDLEVEARDAQGNPVPGVAVSWRIDRGGGSLTRSLTTTDLDGRARVGWTLGAGGGPFTAVAEVANIDTEVFTAQPACSSGIGRGDADGVLTAEETACAARDDFSVALDGTERPATLYWMHDGAELYLALVLHEAPPPTLRIGFDADPSGRQPLGADALLLDPAAGSFMDQHVHVECSGDLFACTEDDLLAGGTEDGRGAVGTEGPRVVYEVVHPLASGDDKDVQASPGDTLRLLLTIRRAGGAGEDASYLRLVTLAGG